MKLPFKIKVWLYYYFVLAMYSIVVVTSTPVVPTPLVVIYFFLAPPMSKSLTGLFKTDGRFPVPHVKGVQIFSIIVML